MREVKISKSYIQAYNEKIILPLKLPCLLPAGAYQ